MLKWLARVARIGYNAVLDLRYGAPLAGEIPTRYGHRGAKDTANSDYLALDRIFAGRITGEDVLVDVGCGKGRVINWWLRKGYRNQIYGLELDDAIAERTRRRLRRHRNVTVVTGDAVHTLPATGTLFYLYNPFHAEIMHRFAGRLSQLGAEGQRVRVLYNNCKYLQPFLDNHHWQVEILDPKMTAPFDRVAAITFTGQQRQAT